MTRNERLVSVGRRLRRLGDGPLRGVAPLVHRSVTSAELVVLPRLDRRGRELPSPDEGRRLAERVTMVVKTFERPEVVRRLVRTARTVFLGRIVIADDSREPVSDLGAGVEVLALPFNVGLSAGRNAAVDEVTTEYVFVTDDDSVFTRATDIVAMMQYLDANPDVDLIAPQLIYLPWRYTFDTQDWRPIAGAAPPLRTAGEQIDGARVVLKTMNVFLARTAAIQALRWDDQLRLIEHDDFFSRACGTLVAVQADGLTAYHARTPFNDFYMKYRGDTAGSQAAAHRVWEQRARQAVLPDAAPRDNAPPDNAVHTTEDESMTTSDTIKAIVLHEGLDFGEGPRWQDGKLWFSDFYRKAVFTLDADGTETRIVDVPGQPSGLGWLPDGTLLVSSMTDRKVLRLTDEGLVEHADVGEVAGYHVNDLITDDRGRAYVGNFGYDLHADMAERDVPTILGDESAGATDLALVHPDGRVEVAAEGVRFPNGMAIVDDGRTLILAETLRMQLTAFDIEDDGTLSNRRVYASTAEQMSAPDGIWADPQGGVWVAPALSPMVIRYADGGEVMATVETSQPAFAVTLGGADGRTLYAMTAPSSVPSDVDGLGLGRIESAQV